MAVKSDMADGQGGEAVGVGERQEYPEGETIPGTAFTPRQVRILKIAVIAMGVLLIGGFAVVLSAIVYQASQVGQDGKAEAVKIAPAAPAASAPAGSALKASIVIPGIAAERIDGVTLEGNRLVAYWRGADGPEAAVIDLTTGKILSRLRFER